MTSYVGYNLNGDFYVKKAAIDDLRLYKGLLTESAIQALAARGNLDNDYDVDFSDLEAFAGDWLDNHQTAAEQTYVVDDMEGSIAGWAVWPPTAPSTGTGTLSLTTNAYSGTGALRWEYSLPATAGQNNYTTIIYDLGTTVNFSSYDRIKLALYRHAGNSAHTNPLLAGEELLYLKFISDSNTVKAEAWIEIASCVTVPADEWDVWDIGLDSLLGSGGVGSKGSSDLTNIRRIMIGCGSWDRNDARTGTIDIDDVQIIKDPVCSSKLEADINSDCKVNFKDFAIFAEDWMLGIQ
jgi:hypothetical protein